MNNSEEIARHIRQLERELAQRHEGQKRLQDRTKRAEDKSYASSTVYGQAILRKQIGKVAELLLAKRNKLRRGKGSVDGSSVFNHLEKADLKVIAILSMKVCLDVLGKDSTPQLVDLTVPIGRAIETELRLDFYHSSDPDLYKRVTNQFHSSTGTRQKSTVYRIQFNREGIEWSTWPRTTCHKIGSWSLNCLQDDCGWIKKDTIAVGRRKHKTVMRYSPEFLQLKEAILNQAERLAFCAWPMVCKPDPWSNEQSGGYKTEAIRKLSPLVRRKGNPLKGGVQGELPITMLNNLQDVGLRVNLSVFGVAKHCQDHSYTVGKFKIATAKPVEPMPEGELTKEDLKEWKRRCREINDFNAQLEQKNYRTIEAMYVANKYKDEEVFWVPWNFCYRGRLYPQVTALSPQGTDFDKSLLYFYEEGPINEYWLAFQVATTYGLDKATMDERISWTRNNINLISQVATNPYDLSNWENVEEPWCFLASCFEYHSCCIAKTKETSGLPCGIDATQSGIQHLSALTLDKEAAEKVNVLPTAKPADGYRTVAESSLKYISDKSVHSFIDRKVAKRTTMTLPYGVTRDSARGYIRTALKEKELDLSIKGRLTEITKAIYERAIPEIFAGPVEVMKWLQASAKEIMQTQEQISWKTPSGFVVNQDLRQSNSVRVQTRLMGSVVDCFVGEGFGDPDIQHHKLALAPNVVHSLDSALVHLTFAYWDKPFTVIHDCVLARSCDMSQLSIDIRMHFAEMYKDQVLEDWANQVGVEVPQSLIKHTLDINQVNASIYFFC